MALLKTCSQCGKKRLFLFDGICSKCDYENTENRLREERERRNSGMAAAKDLYKKLSMLWSITGAHCDSVEFDDVLTPERILKYCDRFDTMLNKIPECEYFQEVFAAQSSIGASGCFNDDFGTLNVEQVDEKTVKIDFEQLRESINELREKARQYQAASFACVPVDFTVAELLRKIYIAFDIETTGLDSNRDRIIELGAVLFVNEVPVKTFSSLVNAGVSVPYEAYAVNHISDGMLQSAPPEYEVYPKFIEFLGPAINGEILMCAHNARFDFDFLRSTFSRLGYESNIKYVDTLNLARRCVYGLQNYKQPTLVKYFGLPKGESHRAATDAKHCGEILRELLRRVDNMLAEDMHRETRGEWFQNALPYWQQGEVARKNGQFDEAFALYDKAKAIDGAPSYLYESYAMAYRKLKDYEAEINILSEGIAKLPQDETCTLVERRNRASALLSAQNEAARVLTEKEALRAQKREARQRAAELAAAKPKQPVGRPVAQCSDDGTVIKVFDTISAAAKEVGVDTKGIRSAACGKQKHSGGFCWKYLDSDTPG